MEYTQHNWHDFVITVPGGINKCIHCGVTYEYPHVTIEVIYKCTRKIINREFDKTLNNILGDE